MASQAPPNGPGRGISQLYPTTSVRVTQSQAPPVDTPASGASQLCPSGGSSHAQALRNASKAPSVAPSPSHQPSARPSHAATLRSPSQAPPYQPSSGPLEGSYHQPTIKPSHAATLRGPSQAPCHHLPTRPSRTATLRVASQAPPSYTSSRSPSQYATSSKIPGHGPPVLTNYGTTQLRRDDVARHQASCPPTIVISPPSDTKTLLQRDTGTVTQRKSIHPTLLQRDQSKIPPVTSAIKEASVAPIIRPSKFDTLPSVRSILHSPNDIKMASRQATISQMQGPEREAQEEWALGKLGKLTTGCPQNYGWSRRRDGYICDGGSHYITDLLLAEGMGGMYAVKDKHDWQNRSEGPYYWAGKNERGKNLFMRVPEMS